MADQAQKEKEKGNAAFKAGDYPGAIGHYTAAILADRGDVTYPLNRAAAYLKLGKYEDAERDCNTVLSHSARNVKAYFRRGQAKAGLSHFIDAQRDFTEALRLDPDNAATKEELKKVAGQIESEKRKKSGHHQTDDTFDATLPPAPAPKRRRVPIAIIDAPQTAPSTKGSVNEAKPSAAPERVEDSTGVAAPHLVVDMEESSSRRLGTSASYVNESKPQSTSSSSSAPATPVPIKPPSASPIDIAKSVSFAEAKEAREAKTGKVGGGIFRASGQNMVFSTRTEAPSRSSESPSVVPSTSAEKSAAITDSDGKKSAGSHKSSEPPKPKLTEEQHLSTPGSEVQPSAIPNGSSTLPADTAAHTTTTLFDFVRAWRFALTTPERWKLLQTIPPSSMPSFCKTSLDPTVLVSILETFLITLSSLPTEEDKIKITEYLDGLAKVPRFPTLVLFLSGKEKAIAKEVWRKLGVQGGAPGAWSSLGSL